MYLLDVQVLCSIPRIKIFIFNINTKTLRLFKLQHTKYKSIAVAVIKCLTNNSKPE